MHAYLLECTTTAAGQQPIRIDNKAIGFLIPSIVASSEMTESASGSEWQLCFFKGSRFEQKLAVSFDDKDKARALASACLLDNKNKASNNADLIAQAPQFIHPAGIDLERAVTLASNRALLVDRKRLVYFSFDRHQFKRILLCYALGLAYARAFRQCKTDLTRSINTNSTVETIDLREAMLRFNAEHHCSLPIEPGTHELFAAWKVISEHFHLRALNEELTWQLSEVGAYLTQQYEKEQRTQQENAARLAATQRDARERRDKRTTTALSLAALVLTATSLLSLAQLTPDQFFKNTAAWKAWLHDGETAPAQAGSRGSDENA